MPTKTLPILTLCGLLFATTSNFAEDEPTKLDRAEVEHKFGTEPGKVFHPEKAIDTDEAPSIAIPSEQKDSEPFKYYKVGDNTYFLFGNIAEVDENNRGFNGNAGFVVTDDGVVVIDSLGTPKLGERLISTVKSVTAQPIKYLIITHNHPDHAYGASAFTDIPNIKILGHEGTLEYIASGRVESSLAYRNTFIETDMKAFKPVTPDVLIGGELYDKTTLKVGNITFDIYNTGKHHSFGDLVIHQVEDNIVWISDLAFNNRLTYMADGSSDASIKAHDWLLETFKNAKYMIPGHGSIQTSPFPMVTKTRDYMKRLRQSMAEAVENDVELQEAMDQTQFDDWKDSNMYELNHKKNLDFVYREMENELF